MQRRLAAILAADVVGYSRLVERDEGGTLAALRRDRESLILPKVTQYHGRVVKLMGDGLLVEFPSAVEAVQCAVEIQQALAARDADAASEARIVYRIGINLGDVVVEAGDIYGDGVNIAARLEALADPGGIAISRPVHTQVRDKLGLTFEHLGEQQVKNIARPVGIYRVAMDTNAAALVTPVVQRFAGRRLGPAAAAAALAVVLALGWWLAGAPDPGPARETRKALALPDRPSIAVLPFANLGGDPAQDYFADGMTEDLITDLSRISGLFVIARNSSFAYRDQDVAIRRVAEELGVRYVLEGSVRRSGSAVRINAQLIDATTGGHVWAERYDGELNDVFALQDEVTRQITAILAVRLTSGEKVLADRQETDRPDAYDAFLEGWEHYLRQRPDDFTRAVDSFNRAIELDPVYARAHAALAATYWQSWRRFWQGSVGVATWHDARFQAEVSLAKALESPTPLAHQVAAAMSLQDGEHAEAIEQAERAIALDPNDADSHITMAGALSLDGRPGLALEFIERAMRLNPHYPPAYLYEVGVARFANGELEEAAAVLEQATALNPEDRWSQRLLLATLGLLDRREPAAAVRRAMEEDRLRGGRTHLMFMDPLTIRASAFWHPFRNPDDARRFAEGLRRAGIPE